MHFNRVVALFALALLIIPLAACNEPVDDLSIPAQTPLPIDAQFRDLYERGGGEDVFGPVISAPFTYGQISYQYTVTVLFTYDSTVSEPASVGLAALGLDLGVLEVAVPPPDDPALHYVDGHIIDPAFLPIYEQLGGSRVVGSPLTEPRYNPKYKRIEQYFQNLGFYRSGDYPGGEVGLLAYGAWKCGQSCAQSGLSFEDAQVEPPSPVHPDFRKSVERLGLHFTGFALAPGIIAADGWREQIFENVILAMPPDPGGRAIFRPIPASLGIQAEPPVPPKNNDPEMYFYPLGEGVGHNIPQAFLNYLAGHGGLDASGPPITEIIEISTGVFRQCFANLCLEEHTQETAPMRIRPTPLGFLCWQAGCTPQPPANPPEPHPEIEATSTPLPYPLDTQSIAQPVEDGVVLHVWKKFPVLAPDEHQEIGAIVLQNGVPLPGLSAELTVMLPGGENMKINLQPTGEDGQSFYQLDLIQIPPGSPVEFQVCVYLQAGEATCVQDSFLFWK